MSIPQNFGYTIARSGYDKSEMGILILNKGTTYIMSGKWVF